MPDWLSAFKGESLNDAPNVPVDAKASYAESSEAPAGLPDVREALDDLAEADRVHARLRKRLAFTAQRIDEVLMQPQPDMGLFRTLTAIERPLVEQVIATRPIEQRKPEDDPANLEMARSTTDTLLARIEAAENARQRGAA